MPLIAPGIASTGNTQQQQSQNENQNQQMDWMNKLMGKKISDSTTDTLNFARQDLPKDHRVIEHGSISTQDHNENRLNIHLGEDGTVHHVDYK